MAGKIEGYHVSPSRFVRRMAEQGAIWIAGLLLVLASTPMTELVGVLLIAVVYARNLEFVHECLHGTALAGARANRIAGRLLAIPMLVSFERWRYEHALHHRDVRVEGFRYDYARLTNLRELAIHLLMLRHFSDALAHLALALRGKPVRLPARVAERTRRDYLAIGCVILALVAIGLVFKTWLPVLLWVAPLPFAAILHTHIELPEHVGLSHNRGGALRDSRVIQANAFWTWFVNANNYHAIHHWDARIPMAHLESVHRATALAVPIERYSEFFSKFYRGLWNGATVYSP